MVYHRSQYNRDSQEGLPEEAKARLAHSQRADGKRVFTSDLTVNEFALLHECGFEPLGLVMGTSMYQIGYQRAGWTSNVEMTVLTQAMYAARELAMTRMEEEADVLNADGIVGVRLEVIRHAWGAAVAEFLAIGTAVKARQPGDWRSASGRPFTSDLSGQNFWTLLRTGHRPVALVMGTCVYHVAHRGMSQWFKQVMQNAEMTNFTQALYAARELSLERMQEEAETVNAEGIVGVTIEERTYGWDAHVIEYFTVGTAIVPFGEAQPIPLPTFTLSLNDTPLPKIVATPHAAGNGAGAAAGAAAG
ncbi:MAG: heavy metal-binding domain-containing protein [Abitibacteriaceae bacterium]|nr:heavy metal-binding domain-containing protein [Abditibacteriaceae bacterium]